MRILHVLDHSLPFQSGYVYRTLGIVNQQRALGWNPVLLTSGKHDLPGPAREKIGNWAFLRTSRSCGVGKKLPVIKELHMMTKLSHRIDEVVRELAPDIIHVPSPALNALPAIQIARRHGLPVVY